MLVVHENGGLTPYIRDVARRFAKEGYAALALDILTREGGTSAVERDRIGAALTAAGVDRHVGDFAAARRYLGTVERIDGRHVWLIGFCFSSGLA